MDPSLVSRTASLSLLVQFLLGVPVLASLAVTRETTLIHLALLETFSQGIEFAWYAFFVLSGVEIRSVYRYIDWAWSTPLMLLTSVVYWRYLADDRTTLRSGMEAEAATILAVLCLNWGMLGAGLHYELRGQMRAFYVGCACFVAAFLLLLFVARVSVAGTGLWYFTFVVWSGYGAAALLPSTEKNVAYNLLDIFSKNVFGVVLAVTAFGRTQ